MGMTKIQFKSFVRLLLDDMKNIKNEKGEAEREKMLDKVIDALQSALED